MTGAQPFRFPVRVYYEDTDAAGVVYYANYLKFMERARTEWLESLGFPLAAFEREHGVVFVVHRCEIDFLQPARLNDALDVSVEPVKLGAATIKARQDVRRGADVLTSGAGHAGVPRCDALAARAHARRPCRETGDSRLNLHTDLSFITLITQASIVVQAVLALLVFLSLWSWWQIFLKMFQLRRAARDTDMFEDEFWKGGDLTDLYQRMAQSRTGSGMEHIFSAGFREFSKHRKQGSSSVITLDSARRAMRAAYQREIDALEGHLAGLATVGSVSPYIGLFGTVWGIMNAFRGLANVSQATLANVAPGIAEALIATAIGLFAAIPAVVAYNRYTHDVDRLAVRYESFIEEFSNILQRQKPMNDPHAHCVRCPQGGAQCPSGGRAGTDMRRARKSINQINVVPYIDVMLVLLVIFMVTAPLISPGEIELPSVGSRLTHAGAAVRSHAAQRPDADAARPGRREYARRPVTREDLVARIVARQAKQEQPVVDRRRQGRALRRRARRARPPAAQRREEGRPARPADRKLASGAEIRTAAHARARSPASGWRWGWRCSCRRRSSRC